MIRDQSSRILVENHVSYEVRKDFIIGHKICNDACNNLEICVLSKNSFGSINGWFDSQCKHLPNNFESIKKRYSGQKDQTYVIYSQRVQYKSSASIFFVDFKYLIFIMVLVKLA